jgi:hypothetical protein
MGKTISAFDHFSMGSSLSLRSSSKFGSAVSMFRCDCLASCLSLRNYSKFGSVLSLIGTLRGNRLSGYTSIQVTGSMGSSLSVRSSIRISQIGSLLDVC